MLPSETAETGYTYDDYLQWPEDLRCELIDGRVYDMSPAPRVEHQRLVSKLDRLLGDHVETHGCRLFIAPVDVILDARNVVQPDVFIVCDRDKIGQEHIRGAPDVVFEVLSPSSALKDRREKKRLYERFGVGEYLLIYPDQRLLERFLLGKGGYGPGEIFAPGETVELQAVEATLPLEEIFEQAL